MDTHWGHNSRNADQLFSYGEKPPIFDFRWTNINCGWITLWPFPLLWVLRGILADQRMWSWDGSCGVITFYPRKPPTQVSLYVSLYSVSNWSNGILPICYDMSDIVAG